MVRWMREVRDCLEGGVDEVGEMRLLVRREEES